jgi:hypothetical protein
MQISPPDALAAYFSSLGKKFCGATFCRVWARRYAGLDRMLSDSTGSPGARRPMLPFDVVPRMRHCDEASTDREYKRRKIDTSGHGEEVYIVCVLLFISISSLLRGSTQSRPGSSYDTLARPHPLTVPDSPFHPHPQHYDSVTMPVPVYTNPPSASTPRCTSPTHPRATQPTTSANIEIAEEVWESNVRAYPCPSLRPCANTNPDRPRISLLWPLDAVNPPYDFKC